MRRIALPRCRSWWWALATAVVLPSSVVVGTSCELPEIPVGVCGNGVLEPEHGEACDLVDRSCGEPGSTYACQLVCDGEAQYRQPGACPAGYVCGLEGLCKQHAGQVAVEPQRLSAGAEELVVGDLDGDRRLDVVRLLDEELGVVFGADRGAEPVEHQQVFEPLFLPTIARRSPVAEAGTGVGGAEAGGLVVRQPSNLIVPRSGLAVFRAGEGQSLVPRSQAALRMPQGLQDVAIVPTRFIDRPGWSEIAWHLSYAGISALATIHEYEFMLLAPTQGAPHELFWRTPVAAQLDEREESPCDDLVLGYDRREPPNPAIHYDQLELFNPCRPDLSTPFEGDIEPNTCASQLFDCPEDMPRRFDLGADLLRGPFVADLNTDGHLDLVVQVASPPDSDCVAEHERDVCYETRVSFGLGDGTFHSDQGELPPPSGVADNLFAVDTQLVRPGQPILALADLDGNGLVDSVSDRLIRLNLLNPYGQVTDANAAANPGEPWTEAVVADFNGNGLLDVAASNGVSRRIYFYNGTGAEALNPVAVPLDAPLSQLRVGDFDGDTLPDLLGVSAIHEASDGDEGVDSQQVTVLFGEPFGALAPPVVLGQTSEPLLLFVGQLGPSAIFALYDVTDRMHDILAISREGGAPDAELDAVYAFLGRGDREIWSPLGLMDGYSDSPFHFSFEAHVARKLVAGHFSTPSDGAGTATEEAPEDLLVLCSKTFNFETEAQLYPWRVPEISDDFEPEQAQRIGARIDERPRGEAAVWDLGVYAAVDMDGDRVDELVALAPPWEPAGASGYRIGHRVGDAWSWFPEDGPGTVELPVSRYSGPTTPCWDPYRPGGQDESECAEEDIDLELIITSEFEVPSVNGRLRVCQLDPGEEGDGPKELVLLSRQPGHGEPDVPAELFVYWLDGSFELRTEGFVRVELPAGAEPRDVACLDTDGDSSQELAVVTSTGVFVVSVTPAGAQSAELVDGTELAGYRRVAAGDVDGDGLDDLVLSNLATTRVLHACRRGDDLCLRGGEGAQP